MKIVFKIFILMVFTGTLTACLQEDALKKPYTGFAPKEINDGHSIATPEENGIDPEGLIRVYQEIHEDDDLWQIRSLLVFRHGNLVAESYMKDDKDITKPRAVWSCTKQVLAIVTGIAIDKGFIDDVHDPISKYIPTLTEKYPDKADITLHNLLTMQSGIGYSNDGLAGQTDDLLRELPDNIMDFILGRPMIDLQGEKFNYNDGNPHVIAGLLQERLNKPTDEWAQEVLFSKLGIENLEWRRYKDGTTLGGYGILTTPREMAKIALFVADGGRWRGEQIIDEEWINTMISTQVTIEDWNYDFGYYWWIDPVRNIQFMWGHGGQFAFICPDRDLVVVITSEPNTQGDHQISADEALGIVDKIIAVSF